MKKFIARIFLISSDKHANLNDAKIINDFLTETPGCMLVVHKSHENFIIASNYPDIELIEDNAYDIDVFDEILFNDKYDFLKQIDIQHLQIRIDNCDLPNVTGLNINIRHNDALLKMFESDDSEIWTLASNYIITHYDKLYIEGAKDNDYDLKLISEHFRNKNNL